MRGFLAQYPLASLSNRHEAPHPPFGHLLPACAGRRSMMSLGFVIALGTAALWALYLVVSRHIVGGAGFDPWAYTLVQVLTGGIVLLWLGRRAPADWRGLLTPWMIGYGVLRVWITGMSSAALVYL